MNWMFVLWCICAVVNLLGLIASAEDESAFGVFVGALGLGCSVHLAYVAVNP